VKNVSDKVVRHSLAYLSVQKWLVAMPPSPSPSSKVTHPFKNADFQSIFARSASAVTPSEKVQSTRKENPLRAFHWA